MLALEPEVHLLLVVGAYSTVVLVTVVVLFGLGSAMAAQVVECATWLSLVVLRIEIVDRGNLLVVVG